MRPFDCVLVANRGEIARRVLRTLHSLGIRSVAVYSDADIDAPHVREADSAVRLGGAPAAESYLDVDAVVRAAVAAGAQAVHPGYGFLSESARLAEACARAGIVFIGPGLTALEVMGDKIRAKEHVASHGVPVVPGFSAAGFADDEIRGRADGMGFPLLVKPSAGGGGKGMQVVRSAEHLPDALATARRIASAAFGDDTLLLERLIERPRHIEVQVLCDSAGGIVHLGERECTLQRRHQKVIEEAPSPVVDEPLRERLGAAACAAAQSVDYLGVGTVEFLIAADQPDDIFFIEMNTRLQVEHPVTELVTGIDLVAAQLRVAAGEPLWFAQDDVRLTGHAVEARVYAESPARGFLPATGPILYWRAPRGVRTDAGVETGSLITAHYDPLIAKVIAHAGDRSTALAQLDRALAETVALGVDTNLSFLRDLLADPAVGAGDLDTGLIDRLGIPAHVQPSATVLAAAASALAPPPADGVWGSLPGWRLATPVGAVARVRDDAGDIHTTPIPDVTPPHTVVARDGDAVWVHDGTQAVRLQALSRRDALDERLAQRQVGDAATTPHLRSPMPGTVVAVHVDDGASVAAGDRLVTVEAMKMEHVVAAPAAGTVHIHVAAGTTVRRDDLLAEVTQEEHDAH